MLNLTFVILTMTHLLYTTWTRITAMMRNQATRRERAKLQVVWELEQAKVKTFEGAKGDLEQANQARRPMISICGAYD